MLRWWQRTPPPLDDTLWQQTCQQCLWLSGLSAERERKLRALVELFLQRKTITPVAGLELDDGQRMVLAALCCLPLIEFGREGLHGWSELVVYPDAFRVRQSHTDAAGVLHEWDDELIGEAWGSGPLILSWADVQADIADPQAGFCVAVHEMAHKIDALDGAIDGTPPLPRDWQRQWARDFQQAYDAFCVQVDADVETVIDPYAAEAPEEFFAVVSEYHFSAPELLVQTMPAVAAHLRRFYGPVEAGLR
ncbi:M90 family metallopeptidase [Stenotrophomonas sp. PS02298]|uniref:M90 family metallopeptidase n=1 Tax=Stenotrophomonas sp. PS02298 TaxID=2991424 RepID=UPI002499B632|nr:M90 family metallopeptidase [Stenotrophomonas sp. PS02298]